MEATNKSELNCIAHSERITVLETKVDALSELHSASVNKLDEIHHMLTRYKGFFGGISFVFGSMVVCWTMLHDWLVSHWR